MHLLTWGKASMARVNECGKISKTENIWQFWMVPTSWLQAVYAACQCKQYGSWSLSMWWRFHALRCHILDPNLCHLLLSNIPFPLNPLCSLHTVHIHFAEVIFGDNRGKQLILMSPSVPLLWYPNPWVSVMIETVDIGYKNSALYISLTGHNKNIIYI